MSHLKRKEQTNGSRVYKITEIHYFNTVYYIRQYTDERCIFTKAINLPPQFKLKSYMIFDWGYIKIYK